MLDFKILFMETDTHDLTLSYIDDQCVVPSSSLDGHGLVGAMCKLGIEKALESGELSIVIDSRSRNRFSSLYKRTIFHSLDGVREFELLEDFKIKRVFLVRDFTNLNGVYRLMNLDEVCLDIQLQTLTGFGWTCKWEETEKGIFTHPDTDAKITF